MKTQTDPRHQKRIHLMQQLFAFSFRSDTPHPDIAGIMDSLHDVDSAIQKAAPEWPIDKISRTDLAILRLSVFELMVEKKEPPKVIIDEAVELAKSYGNPSSGGFVNGVLGTILKTL